VALLHAERRPRLLLVVEPLQLERVENEGGTAVLLVERQQRPIAARGQRLRRRCGRCGNKSFRTGTISVKRSKAGGLDL